MRRRPLHHGRVDLGDLDVERGDLTTDGRFVVELLALELLRKVEKELAAIEKLDDEATVRRRVAALNVEIAKVNATAAEGPPTRLSTLDVDKVVARWRRTRPANPGGSSPVSRPPPKRRSTKF